MRVLNGAINAKMTPRRQAVLGLVIRSYVDRGLPVGSKAFVAGFGLEISPATIRNEMAALEEMGYLTHPHTSAGRVPTEQGYRYFVEYLLRETELPLPEENKFRHQFHQARLELDQWCGWRSQSWPTPRAKQHWRHPRGRARSSSSTWS